MRPSLLDVIVDELGDCRHLLFRGPVTREAS